MKPSLVDCFHVDYGDLTSCPSPTSMRLRSDWSGSHPKMGLVTSDSRSLPPEVPGVFRTLHHCRGSAHDSIRTFESRFQSFAWNASSQTSSCYHDPLSMGHCTDRSRIRTPLPCSYLSAEKPTPCFNFDHGYHKISNFILCTQSKKTKRSKLSLRRDTFQPTTRRIKNHRVTSNGVKTW